MICANFATFTVAGAAGTLAATGRVYEPPCSTMDSVVMTYGEYVAVVPQDKNAVFNFDYAYASGLWMLAFCFVLGLYLVAKNAGIILRFIRG